MCHATSQKSKIKKLLPVVKQCANDSMVNNAVHVKEIIENDAGECGISTDGAWQKRGYSPHNGVVTQLNRIIWNRCPKTTYVEQETVALATYLAVLKFNDGDISYLKILEDLDITPWVLHL